MTASRQNLQLSSTTTLSVAPQDLQAGHPHQLSDQPPAPSSGSPQDLRRPAFLRQAPDEDAARSPESLVTKGVKAKGLSALVEHILHVVADEQVIC